MVSKSKNVIENLFIKEHFETWGRFVCQENFVSPKNFYLDVINTGFLLTKAFDGQFGDGLWFFLEVPAHPMAC